MTLDVSLWLVSGRLRDAGLIAGVTVAAWWFLSDYYVGRVVEWPAWLETLAFIPASVAFVWLMSRQRHRALASELGASEQSVRVGPAEITAKVARALLLEASRHVPGKSAADYLRWHATRLFAVDDAAVRPVKRLARAWWWKPRSLVRVWLIACWLPALWVVLTVLPRHTGVMEWLADRVQGHPTELYDAVVSGREPAAKRNLSGTRVTESVWKDGDDKLVRFHTALVSTGTVTVHVTDFPRVYRRIQAICVGTSPGCGVVFGPNDDAEPHAMVPVRAGRASVQFVQITPDPRLDLKLRLLIWDGTVIGEVTIER
jgi:hypothetical protein